MALQASRPTAQCSTVAPSRRGAPRGARQRAANRALGFWSCLLVAWSALSACGFDKYEMREVVRSTPTDSTEVSDAAVPVDMPDCAVGEYRCEGVALQQCEVGVAGGWKTIQSCDNAERCNAQQQRCEECEPGTGRCDGWELSQCRHDGLGWVQWTRRCESAEHCNASAVRCDACLPGEASCNGNRLLTCNQGRTGHEEQLCDSADECNVHSMTCRPCVLGELECNGAQLRRCNDDREWVELAMCATGALCRAGLDAHWASGDEPRCAQPACEEQQTRCEGELLLGCPPGRHAWQVLDVCASSELCGRSTGNQCLEPSCQIGAMRCVGNELQRCNDDGTGWQTLKRCGDAELCNTARRDCVPCNPGDKQCNDRELQHCDENRVWQTTETCSSWTACSSGEQQACAEPSCPVGSWSCNGRQLESCTAYGRSLHDVCASVDLCDANAGRCLKPRCEAAGLLRCAGDVLQQCSGGLDDWSFVEQCSEGTVCDLHGEGCAERCPEHPYRCNDGQPEECLMHPDGSVEWQPAGPHCETAGLCVVDAAGVSCRAPVCGGTLPEYRCNPGDPQVIEQCAPDRASWVPSATCASGQTCDPGPDGQGPPQCDVCEPDSYACSSTGELLRCTSDGQRLITLEACGGPNRCEVSEGGREGRCIPCAGDETRCDGGNLLACVGGEWELEQSCAEEGCQDVPGDHDYCRVCRAPEERRCDGPNTLLSCNAEQTEWIGSQTCAAGCQENGLQDYCRECEPNTAECSGDGRSRRVCGVDGRWQQFDRCLNSGRCIDAGSSDYCDMCEPGTASCVGENRRRVCWEGGRPGAIEICPEEEPFCLNPGGRCVECLPGAAPQCENSTTRRICSVNGAWASATCSGATPACLNGECVACTPGTKQCTGTTLGGRSVCDAAGRWQSENCTAAGSEVCLMGECVACHPGQTRCSEGGREVCSESGTWETGECGDGELCVDGQCQDCLDGTARCTSGGREECVAGRWMARACPTSEPVCVDDGACICEEGTWSCDGTDRRQCRSGVWQREKCDRGWCSDGVCVECDDSSDCSNADLPICQDGACVCKEGTRRCAPELGTSSYDVCEGGTWQSKSCPGSQPVCAAGGACACVEGSRRCFIPEGAELGERQLCEDGVWQDQGIACQPCESDDNCSGDTPLCDGIQCVGCGELVRNCPGQRVCMDTRCVECTSSNPGICYGQMPACSADNRCVECSPTNATLCVGDRPICENNSCRGCEEGECGAGLVCDTDSGACVQCRAGHDDCGNGLLCEDQVCVCPGALCADGRLCSGGRCDACTEGYCPSGYACVDGHCSNESTDD